MATNVTSLKYMIISLISAAAAQLTDEEYHRLPKLYHLDDYERCLSQKTGVYCLGTFELTADQNHTVYQLMQKHTIQHLTFNRSLLHRGYCVSDRCPLSHSSFHYERNATLRFERCVAKRALRHSLVARLSKLEYCTTHRQHQDDVTRAPDAGQQMFLYAVYFILFINVVGTLYDVYFVRGSGKNSLFMLWSIPANWRLLTHVEENGAFSDLAPLQSVRLTIQWIMFYAHAGYSHYLVHVYNAEGLEKLHKIWIGNLLRNGSTMVTLFTLISCFLTGYIFLLSAKIQIINARTLYKWILKRLFRILPVYLVVLGYAVTWWPRAGDGPMWSAVVGAESAVCRKKFWYQVFFVNNLVDASEMCLLPSWAVAVDIQLYVLSVFIVLLFMKLRVEPQPILAGLYVAAGALNVLLAYIAGWDPMIKIICPDNLRLAFQENTEFTNIHISPWSHLPSCLFGLLMAYYYYEQKNNKDKDDKKPNTRPVNENKESENVVGNEQFGNEREGNAAPKCKNELDVINEQIQNEFNEQNKNGIESNEQVRHRFVGSNKQTQNILDEIDVRCTEGKLIKRGQRHILRGAHMFCIPALYMWVVLGSNIDNIDSKLATALYVGLERVVFNFLLGVSIIELCTFDSYMRRWFAWRGWQAVGRLAFTSMMLHWCVNLNIVAGRPNLIASTPFFISLDWISTIFYTYLLALPMCLLVEIPMRRFLNVLCF